MDGQGPIGAKDDTYGAITAGVKDRWLWGWKCLYEENSPAPTPVEGRAFNPAPVPVTCQ